MSSSLGQASAKKLNTLLPEANKQQLEANALSKFQSHDGIYWNTWRYKRNTRMDTAYVLIRFLNDTTFLYNMQDERPSEFKFNNTGFNLPSVGRKIIINGSPRYFIIRDLTGLQWLKNIQRIEDTASSIDFKQAVTLALRLYPTKGAGIRVQADAYPKAYEIYELHFYTDSLLVQAIRTQEIDNGDEGLHYKIKALPQDALNEKRKKTNSDLSYGRLPHGDTILQCVNCFTPAQIVTPCQARYTPVSEQIPLNNTPYQFKKGDQVLVNKNPYLDYGFVVTLNQQKKIRKYGWVLMANIQLEKVPNR